MAVVGSVFSSFYGPELARRLAGLPVPEAALDAARESVQAAAAVAAQAPAAAQPVILDAARQAFLDGMAGGTRVAAVGALIGAVLAALYLPARAADAVVAVDAGDAEVVDRRVDV